MGERYIVLKDNLGWGCLYDNYAEEYIITDGKLSADSYVEDVCELLNKYDVLVKGLMDKVNVLKKENINLYYFAKELLDGKSKDEWYKEILEKYNFNDLD